MSQQNKKRLQLVALMLVFLAPVFVAAGLHLAGWKPDETRNHGILIEPPQDIAADTPRVLDAKPFSWKDPEYRWTLLIVAGPGCAAACGQRLSDADKIWSLMTQKATRLRLAVVGLEPTPALREQFPRIHFLASEAGPLNQLRPAGSDSAIVAIVDPAGLLMLRYAPGYDPSHVRQDLSRLIH